MLCQVAVSAPACLQFPLFVRTQHDAQPAHEQFWFWKLFFSCLHDELILPASTRFHSFIVFCCRRTNKMCFFSSIVGFSLEITFYDCGRKANMKLWMQHRMGIPIVPVQLKLHFGTSVPFNQLFIRSAPTFLCVEKFFWHLNTEKFWFLASTDLFNCRRKPLNQTWYGKMTSLSWCVKAPVLL